MTAQHWLALAVFVAFGALFGSAGLLVGRVTRLRREAEDAERNQH